MPDTRPHLARLAKRSRRSLGDLSAARRRTFAALEYAEAVMRDAAANEDHATVLRAVHATTQAAAAFSKLVEAAELEARIAALEASLTPRNA